MSLVVNYVSAPPGTGKTRAAIQYMANHIRRALAGEPVGYMFYVTPTVLLLKQTLNNLRSELTRDEQQLVRQVTSEDSLEHTTPSRVLRILNGVHNKDGSGRRFGPGSILFITHPTFLKLQYHRKLRDTTVIFDESRKWVMRPRPLPMKGPVKKLFNLLFDTQPLESNGSTYEKILQLTARKVTEAEKSQMLRYKNSAGAHYETLTAIHKQIKEAAKARVEVYAMTHGKNLLQIQLPRRPFEGYRKIFVLSADFKTSQMYHLMKRDGCNMKNATVEFIGKTVYGQYLDAVQKRYGQLVLMPLLNDSEKPPSKGLYTQGVILPHAKLPAFDEYLGKDLQLVAQQVRTFIKRFKDESTSEIGREDIPPKFEPYLKSVGATYDVLEWKVERAVTLAHRWAKKHGSPKEGVMFLNKNLERNLSFQGRFKSLSTGKAEGNNNYLKSNVVCFLAAINPRPAVANLLDALIGHQGYDVNEDYVVDKAIQCLGRGNIRDQESNEPMLAIVSNRYLAERIAARMDDHPLVSLKALEEFGTYTSWDRNNLRKKKTDAERKSSRLASVNKLRANPYQRQFDNAKRRLKYAVEHGQHPNKIAELEALVRDIEQKRNESK